MPFRLRDCLPFAHFSSPPFVFLDPGPLVDRELELVAPSVQWIDGILDACRHPLSLQEVPALAETTRRQLLDFLAACPGGRQPPNLAKVIVAEYHFWLHATDRPDLPMAGGVGLRIGNTPDIQTYSGHIGYHVYPPSRGRHYAERAARLLFPLARLHNINPIWITCNPDNFASRRTCERLGAKLVEIVPVPAGHILYQRGETQKCRYRIDLE